MCFSDNRKLDVCDYTYMHTQTHTVGEHYEDTSKVATIRPMSASYCFSLLIINNDIYDINGRDFTATIYTSDSAVVIQDDIISLHIIDNDGKL